MTTAPVKSIRLNLSLISLVLTAAAFAQTNTFPVSGNVGIGTTSPSVKLQVSGAVAIQGAAGFPTSGYGFEFVPSAIAGVDAIQTYNRDTNSWREFRLLGSTVGFWTNASERMRIDSNGNVGVGTNYPAGKLTVHRTVMCSYPDWDHRKCRV